MDTSEDLVNLHALVASGVQDSPCNWLTLNHLKAINDLLGQKTAPP